MSLFRLSEGDRSRCLPVFFACKDGLAAGRDAKDRYLTELSPEFPGEVVASIWYGPAFFDVAGVGILPNWRTGSSPRDELLEQCLVVPGSFDRLVVDHRGSMP